MSLRNDTSDGGFGCLQIRWFFGTAQQNEPVHLGKHHITDTEKLQNDFWRTTLAHCNQIWSSNSSAQSKHQQIGSHYALFRQHRTHWNDLQRFLFTSNNSCSNDWFGRMLIVKEQIFVFRIFQQIGAVHVHALSFQFFLLCFSLSTNLFLFLLNLLQSGKNSTAKRENWAQGNWYSCVSETS